MSAATRQKLAGAGTVRIAAVLARHGCANATVAGPRPLTPGQDPLVGIAVSVADRGAAGGVLVLRDGAPPPSPALLQRHGLAGVLSERPLREAGAIAGAGLVVWQGPLRSDVMGAMLLGDRSGLIAFPAALADIVAEEATEAMAYEEFLAEQVSSGGGVYGLHIPSGEQARRAFAQWRRLRGR